MQLQGAIVVYKLYADDLFRDEVVSLSFFSFALAHIVKISTL